MVGVMGLAVDQPPAIIGADIVGNNIHLPVHGADHRIFIQHTHDGGRQAVPHTQNFGHRVQPLALFQSHPAGQPVGPDAGIYPLANKIHIGGEISLWAAAYFVFLWQRRERRLDNVRIRYLRGPAGGEYKGAMQAMALFPEQLRSDKGAVLASPQHVRLGSDVVEKRPGKSDLRAA